MVKVNSETKPDETAQAIGGWRNFSIETLVTEGLLAYVNNEFFWPYGLALTAVAERIGPGDRDFDWAKARLKVTEAVPPQTIITGRKDHDVLLERADAWLGAREEELIDVPRTMEAP